MDVNFISRRRGGQEGLTIFGSSRRQTAGGRVRVVHRSLRTNVIAAAKARAKLIIEPILNGQWETAEKLKSKSGYATIGEILERYQANAEDRPATVRNNSQRASTDHSHGSSVAIQTRRVLRS